MKLQMFKTMFLNIENNNSPASLTLLNQLYTIWHHKTESYKGSVFHSCIKIQVCFLATYCKQGLKKALSAFIHYNSRCEMEFTIHTEVRGAKWSLWHCANLMINSLQLLFYPKYSLQLSFWINTKRENISIYNYAIEFQGRKKHPSSSFLSQYFLYFTK